MGKEECPNDAQSARKTRRLRTAKAAFYFTVASVTTICGYALFWSGNDSCSALFGYTQEGLSFTSSDYEKLFLSIPNNNSAHSAAQRLAKQPHLLGSTQDFEDSKDLLHFFQKELGISQARGLPIFEAGSAESQQATVGLSSADYPSAWIDEYYPYLDEPAGSQLQVLGNDGSTIWTADLSEDGDPLDGDAERYRNTVPPWHEHSFHGEAEGYLIYANYGTQEDYVQLLAGGSDLKGKIVLVRSGAVFRGLKIKGAQELGAAGVLIYSDTRDDGYITTENGFAAYPNGPARNPSSVERGSVSYMSEFQGDPSTPGYPAYRNATRQKVTNFPTIPSLPISWNNAKRLMEEIGEVCQAGTDEVGKRILTGKTSSSTIRLVNHVKAEIKPIWNVMAAIPGHIRDEVVIIGCHRDGGTAALHEVVRGYGALLRKGWKPLRTVVFASWDGPIGSVEYGEDFAPWLSERVVAYLNLDTASAGSRWIFGGSPSLAHLIKQVALDIPHPTTKGKTLWDARTDAGPLGEGAEYNGSMVADVEFMEAYRKRHRHSDDPLYIGPLVSGSDSTVFLHRIGVATMDQGFLRTPTDAVYHYYPIHDSLRWQEKYGDPGFQRHVAIARHLGLMGLRLADSIILPLNTTHYAHTLSEWLNQIEDKTPTNLDIDFSSLRSAVLRVQQASAVLDAEREDAEEQFLELRERLPRRRTKHCSKRHPLYTHLANVIKGVFGVAPANPNRHASLSAISWQAVFKINNDEFGATADQEAFRIAAERVTRVNQRLRLFEQAIESRLLSMAYV